MAFFGDTLSHAALLGVILGTLLEIGPDIGVLAVGAAVSLLLVVSQRRKTLVGDTLLGIFSHSALALGLVAVAFIEGPRVDLMSILFGDILAVDVSDLVWLYGGGIAVALALILMWQPLLAATIHEEMASVEGVPVNAVRLVFMLLLAVVVGLAMKVVGILLVTALLIIPPAAARSLSASPEGMAALAAVFGCGAVAGGLWGSLIFDTPSGPSIVVAALLVFLFSLLPSAFRRRR